MLKLYNTLNRKKKGFKPLKPKTVGLYGCGPTVYDFAHIGNLRTYIFEDLLKRVLLYNNCRVKHIMNITDVGHLTSDADTGEDKLEKGALREKKTVWQIADFYTKQFKKDLKALNILEPSLWLKATETIKEQIDLIKILERKGFTYQIEDGLYFDTSRLKNYGILWGNKKPMELKAGARVEMTEGKKHPTDFALWKLTPPGVKRQMEWDSPWGRGFPGWHTECVAMSVRALGIPFDVHCGGIDHIPIHHTNEIAQAQAAYGKRLANFWLHGEFLNLTASKMSKSKGNIITLAVLAEKGFTPLSFRYLCLTAHYRAKLNFSWKSLTAVQNGLDKLHNLVAKLPPPLKLRRASKTPAPAKASAGKQNLKNPYRSQFLNFINDDLDMPKALALLWKLLNDKKLNPEEKYALVLEMDKVFGLGLDKIKIKKEEIPKEIFALAEQREGLRKQKQWQRADKIRKQIQKLGYAVEDTEAGSNLKRQESPNNNYANKSRKFR